MTMTELRQGALQLPTNERLELAEALLESLEASEIPLYAWQRRILDERLDALEGQPEEGAPWEDVEKRVWSSEP